LLLLLSDSWEGTNINERLYVSGKKSAIKQRYMHLNEELLAANPDFTDLTLPSLDARVKIASAAVPELAAAAATKAIAEWGRPATEISHLIFSTYSGARAPSADRRLASLLGLSTTVSRTLLNLHGCYGGDRSLQLAKELAENNRGARILVACSEITLIAFHGPEGGCPDNILGQALFGDGAGAVIIGAEPPTPSDPWSGPCSRWPLPRRPRYRRPRMTSPWRSTKAAGIPHLQQGATAGWVQC
jgi:predicted naringenin-chalcone synthase